MESFGCGVSSSRKKASTCLIDELGKTVITDEDETLIPFCESIEAILRQGLKKGIGAFGLVDRDYWSVIEGLPTSSRLNSGPTLSIRHAIATVKGSEKVTTAQGRGRLFIRVALTKGVLGPTLQFLADNKKYCQYWYKDISIFASDSERGAVLSLLKVIHKKTFKLDLSNCSFLDETWLLPGVERFEFVPCALIGLTLHAVKGKCIIVDVTPGSLSDEKGVVSGDCLDELFGQHINEKWCLKITQLKKTNRRKPVQVSIVKGQYPDGRWFPPVVSRYTQCVKIPSVQNTKNASQKSVQGGTSNVPRTDQDQMKANNEYEVTYLGASDIGKRGHCSVVQEGIRKLLHTGTLEKNQVKIQLLERDIHVTCQETGERIGKYSYTETSACAVGESDPCIFGFAVGNTTCSFADSFKCHVFSADRPATAHQIIEGIGKGFDRTVYCV